MNFMTSLSINFPECTWIISTLRRWVIHPLRSHPCIYKLQCSCGIFFTPHACDVTNNQFVRLNESKTRSIYNTIFLLRLYVTQTDWASTLATELINKCSPRAYVSFPVDNGTLVLTPEGNPQHLEQTFCVGSNTTTPVSSCPPMVRPNRTFQWIKTVFFCLVVVTQVQFFVDNSHKAQHWSVRLLFLYDAW